MDPRMLQEVKKLSDEAKKEIRQTAKVFEESLVNTPGWKLYCSALEDLIKVRQGLLEKPVNDLAGQDTQGKLFAQETIKGAIIALRLALSLPQNILDSAKELAQEEMPRQEGEAAATPGEKSP